MPVVPRRFDIDYPAELQKIRDSELFVAAKGAEESRLANEARQRLEALAAQLISQPRRPPSLSRRNVPVLVDFLSLVCKWLLVLLSSMFCYTKLYKLLKFNYQSA